MKRRLLCRIALGFAMMLIPFALLLKTGASARSPRVFYAVAPPMTFTVTTNGDTGAGSLRSAIDQANTNPGSDMIDFNPGLGTINVGSVTGLPLPFITEAVTIDGGAAKVELNGAAAGAGADGLLLDGTGITVRNLVINSFSGNGITVLGDGNVVQGNFIGTNAAGTSALPNEGGVVVRSANNMIGGTAAGSRNVISGNTNFGVDLDTNLATDNRIEGNFIGTDAGGTVPLGNGRGVVLFASPSSNSIGGVVAGAGNTIAFNNQTGVFLGSGANNSVLGNSIFSNVGLGINLSDDLVTANDPCDIDSGANDLQNFPVLTAVTSGGGSTTFQGTLDSIPNTTFRIEFFSNSSCDPSGNGEGQIFIGSTNVATNASCTANINFIIGVAIPVGQIVTATASDPAGNTSEFSACVTVTNAAGCTLSCPANVLAFTGPGATTCSTPVSYPQPTTAGTCGTVNCVPPTGSVFAVGSTAINCTEGGGAACSFTVTVNDNTPPLIACGAGVTATAPAGQTSTAVTFATPPANDNCSVGSVVCAPASGSTFPIGTTIVTCTATDVFSNATNCSFIVTVVDADAPVITCPPEISVMTQPGQNSAVVTYPPPTVTDNLPGSVFTCLPTSGSTFPAGITTVTCTATDSSGNKSSCNFSVTVGGPLVRLTIPGGKPSVEFGSTAPVSARRKPQKQRNNPCGTFLVENLGFGQLALTLASIDRVGADVDSGKIGDANDSRYYALSRINADGSQTALDIGGVVQIQGGGTQNFCVRFNPLLPALAGKTTGLAAANVLPDSMTSRVSFTLNAGSPLSVLVSSHVGTALTLIDPANPKRPPVVSFARNGNTLTVSYAVHDANLDLSRTRYEFLNSSQQVVGVPIEVDIGQAISSRNLVRGQSFSVEQDFSGANDHPEITGVRITVFDGEGSVTASEASGKVNTITPQLMNPAPGVTLYLPAEKLGPLFPRRVPDPALK